MEKHAYLIMAHNNFCTLRTLLALLDDPRNDIYLHIDKKVRDFDFKAMAALCRYARVFFPHRRINGKWGHHALVDTELVLFSAAYRRRPYRYYHLISGADLPLKSQDEIHSFFSDKTCDYMGCDGIDHPDDRKRMSTYRYVFGRDTERQRLYSEYADILQRKLKTDRLKRLKHPVYKGAQWVSLTEESVKMLVRRKAWIRRFTRFTFCPDEVYKQTVLIGSGRPYEGNNLRLIDWTRGGHGHPHTFTEGDYSMLTQSDQFFAR